MQKMMIILITFADLEQQIIPGWIYLYFKSKSCVKEEDLDEEDNSTTFQMTALFDKNGNLRVNDTNYDPNKHVSKIWNYINGIKTKTCYLSKKYGYDEDWDAPVLKTYNPKGKETAVYYGCDDSGNNCSGSTKYDYDEHGNQTAQYWGCNGSGNNCSETYTYTNDYVCE